MLRRLLIHLSWSPAAAVSKRLTDASMVPTERIRNFGIIAHVDAGKTTTTERMLYYAGVQSRLGEVDKGNTTTDYMEEEAARGITITAAAVTLSWKDHIFNIVDTPGHIDFNLEVERSLRVMDGAVVLFDAAVGVQGQSYTVLKQARKNCIPVVAYINKMDKSNSNFVRAVASLRKKLNVVTAALQVPMSEGTAGFEGVIDVVEMQTIRWKEDTRGMTMETVPIAEEKRYLQDLAHAARNELLELLLERDEKLLEEIVSSNLEESIARAQLSAQSLRAAVKRQMSDMSFIPVLCGASRRNQGVQPLLDSVIHYLPSPLEQPPLKTITRHQNIEVEISPSQQMAKDAVALVFKVLHYTDAKGQTGWLSFFRVYSGKFTKGRYHNATRRKMETLSAVYVMQADKMKAVESIPAGSIGAAFSDIAHTGDTWLAEARSRDSFVLPGVDVPKPVVGTALEANESSGVAQLVAALEGMVREDPSLSLRETETGQHILTGMGDLHLEIIMSRLARQFGIACTQHPPIIEFRETPQGEGKLENFVVRDTNGAPMCEISGDIGLVSYGGEEGCISPQLCTVEVVVDRDAILMHFQKVHLDKRDALRETEAAVARLLGMKHPAQKGAEKIFANSPKLHVDVVGAHLRITNIVNVVPGSTLSPSDIELGMCRFVTELMKQVGTVVVEPYMYLEVMLSDRAYLGNVMRDLNEVGASSVVEGEHADTVECIIAMRHLSHYTPHLRKLTKGHAQYWYRLDHYRVAPKGLKTY